LISPDRSSEPNITATIENTHEMRNYFFEQGVIKSRLATDTGPITIVKFKNLRIRNQVSTNTPQSVPPSTNNIIIDSESQPVEQVAANKPERKIRYCRSCPGHVPYTVAHSKICKRKAADVLLNDEVTPTYSITDFDGEKDPRDIHVATRTEKKQRIEEKNQRIEEKKKAQIE